jgi:uncharacterized membrane protein YbaN (DUF454 family)
MTNANMLFKSGIILIWRSMKIEKKKSTIKHLLLIIAGSLSLLLGGIGIVMPVLPTTPFVLLAAACYSIASPKLARKLEESRIFGSYLRHWRTHEGVPVKTKVRAIIWLWIGLIVSAVIVKNPTVTIILGIIGILVTLHLILIKTKREDPHEVFTTTGIDT